MSKKETVASLSSKLSDSDRRMNDLMDQVSVLTEIIINDRKEKPVTKAKKESKENKFSADFVSRWNVQLRKAKNSARKNGYPCELTFVPNHKTGENQCYYYRKDSRKLSMDSRKLAYVHSDGRVEPLVNLGNLKVA